MTIIINSLINFCSLSIHLLDLNLSVVEEVNSLTLHLNLVLLDFIVGNRR